MSVPSPVIGEIYRRLDRIAQLSQEVAEIPNFGPDLWTMRQGDAKCEQIRQDAQWIHQQLLNYVDTGS